MVFLGQSKLNSKLSGVNKKLKKLKVRALGARTKVSYNSLDQQSNAAQLSDEVLKRKNDWQGFVDEENDLKKRILKTRRSINDVERKRGLHQAEVEELQNEIKLLQAAENEKVSYTVAEMTMLLVYRASELTIKCSFS